MKVRQWSLCYRVFSRGRVHLLGEGESSGSLHRALSMYFGEDVIGFFCCEAQSFERMRV